MYALPLLGMILWYSLYPALGQIHEIGAPIHVYPLYENAFRAHRGQSLSDNHAESARLYANFSAIASQHPYAWNYDRKDDEERIGMVNERNRMICFPCTFLISVSTKYIQDPLLMPKP